MLAKGAHFLSEDEVLDGAGLVSEMKQQGLLHHIRFRRCATHLPDEADSATTFSRASMLSDPNFVPHLKQARDACYPRPYE